MLKWSFVDRYVLRVQGMQLRLEFIEKKGDLQPALDTLHKAIDGKKYICVIAAMCVIDDFRNCVFGFIEKNLSDYPSNRKHDQCCELYCVSVLCGSHDLI